ncbi:MAG: ABC transporter permease [Acetatifactor sp.]|nr:ABC transporter permease [Acetatifactor sp.]
MNRLMSAGFTRLWKNKFFWLGMILLPGFLAFALFSNYHDMKQYNFSFTINGFLYGCFLLIGMFTSIFAALFLGTEYSDGTIRNKLVIGHSRTAVYLSSLAVCFVSSLLVCLTTIIITYALGIPLFGTPETPVLTIVQEYAYGVLMIAALSGIFTLLAMMITSKSVSAIVCTVGIFALLFISMYILKRLLAPEMIEYGYNPRYLTGTARKVYEFLQDFLPTGQGMQLAQFGHLQHPLQACLCSLFVTAGTTMGGILAFQKKNLK